MLATFPTRQVGAVDWQSFRGVGFTVDHPAGWHVQTDPSRGSVTLEGNTGEQVTLWPLFVRKEMTHDLARNLIQQLVSRSAPTFRWNDSSKLGNSAVKMTGDNDSGDVAVAGLSWVATKECSAACLSIVSAPSAIFDKDEDTFAEVLAGLRLTGSVAESPAAEIEFQRWRDPNEAAFDVEIPKDWQVHGGLARFGEADTRFAIEVRAPDGRLRVYLGNADIPTFVVPSATLEGAGFVEGSWYAPPLGTRMQVRRAMSGAQFARWFATTFVARDFTALKFTKVRNRPDVDRALTADRRRVGLPSTDQQIKAGETVYTCRDEQAAYLGYAFAATLEKPLPRGNGDQWSVQQNFGYLAPVDDVRMAQAVLLRLVSSFQIDANWVAKQKHLSTDFVKTSSQNAARLPELLGVSHESQDHVREREDQLRKTANVVLEMSDPVELNSGKSLRVESGAGYYWIDPRGNIVGTESYSVPNVDFRELVRRKP